MTRARLVPHRLLPLAAALTLWIPACDDGAGGSETDGTTGHDSQGSEHHESHGSDSDSGDALEVDTYEEGMTKMSENHMFMVKLTSEPGPPIKGMNSWTLEVMNHDDMTPIDGATLEVTPWMPEHGHGSSSVVMVSPVSGGVYIASPVELQMLGVWDTTISITDGDHVDDVHFVFDVQSE